MKQKILRVLRVSLALFLAFTLTPAAALAEVILDLTQGSVVIKDDQNYTHGDQEKSDGDGKYVITSGGETTGNNVTIKDGADVEVTLKDTKIDTTSDGNNNEAAIEVESGAKVEIELDGPIPSRATTTRPACPWKPALKLPLRMRTAPLAP